MPSINNAVDLLKLKMTVSCSILKLSKLNTGYLYNYYYQQHVMFIT